MYTRCDKAAFANCVSAVSRTNSNLFEFVKLTSVTMIFTKLTVSQEANFSGNLTPRRVAATYRLMCPGLTDDCRVNVNAAALTKSDVGDAFSILYVGS